MDKKLRKAQSNSSSISFNTIVSKKASKGPNKRRTLSDLKADNFKINPDSKTDFPSQDSKLPRINFGQNFELFKDNMAGVIDGIMESSQANTQELLKQHFKAIKDKDAEIGRGLRADDHSKQDFVPLGSVFNRIGGAMGHDRQRVSVRHSIIQDQQARSTAKSKEPSNFGREDTGSVLSSVSNNSSFSEVI